MIGRFLNEKTAKAGRGSQLMQNEFKQQEKLQARILEDLTSKFYPSDNREDTAILYEITGFQRNTKPNTVINEPDENLIFDSMPEKQAESPKPSQDLKTKKNAHWSYDYD